MPLCFEDGKPYECPQGEHLLVLIENDGGKIKVNFASEINDPEHAYTGTLRLRHMNEKRHFIKDGIEIFTVSDPTIAPPPQIGIIVTAFVCALGRFEPDFNHVRKSTKQFRLVLAFKPLPPLST